MGANFTPTFGGYSPLTPFRYWCQKVLPLSYDDSLSYYELLNKVVDYLNKTMEDVETLHDDIDAMLTAFNALQTYVNTYFDELDLTEQVQIVLDRMAENGSLDELLRPIVGEQIGGVVAEQIGDTVAAQIYDTVANQINAVVRSELPEAIGTQVSTWLAEHVDPETGYVIDKSLTIGDAAADAKIVGERIVNIENNTLKPNSLVSWTTGTFVAADGSTTITQNRKRTTKYYSFKEGVYSVQCLSDDIEFRVYAWYNDLYVGVYFDTDGTFKTESGSNAIKWFDLYKYPNYDFLFAIYPTDPSYTITDDEKYMIYSTNKNINKITENSDQIDGIKNVAIEYCTIPEWELGSISSETGINAARNDRIRTVNYIDLSLIGNIIQSIDLDITFRVLAYDKNTLNYVGTYFDTYKSFRQETYSNQLSVFSSVNYTNYVYKIVAMKNSETITLEDSEKIVGYLNKLGPDSTLSIAGKSADAYTTGKYVRKQIIYNASNHTLRRNIIIATGKWSNVVTTNLSRSIIIKIPDGAETVTFTTSGAFAILKSANYNEIVNGNTPDYADEYSNRISGDGTSHTYAIYNDCKYLYFTKISSAGTVYDIGNIIFVAKSCTPDYEIYYTDNHDYTIDIQTIIDESKTCKLSNGQFTVANTIYMSSNSEIIGNGFTSHILWDNTVGYDAWHTKNVIEMSEYCKVSNIKLSGNANSITLTGEIGDVTGIAWVDSNNRFGIVENCLIQHFDYAGILMQDQGTPTDKGLIVSGCFIKNCNYGIFIRKNSEFNIITGCIIVWNYYGFYNRGGNNKISNCGIDRNTVGVMIDQEEGTNGGHGGIDNCTMNHSNGNTGYAIIISDTGRMLISNCNIYYSKVRLENTNGNIISNCGFGQSTGWEIAGGECSIFANCIIRSAEDTPITITDNTTVKIVNCYTRNGEILGA